MDTIHVSIELPREILSALRQDPESFVREMRLAAAVKWYEMKLISQAKAAEVAGVSRSEFLTSLQRFGVSPFQYDADEIAQEVKVPEHWVLNASPLIVLSRIAREELLFALADEVVVPRAVATEIEAGPAEDRARQVLSGGRLAIVDTPPPTAELLAWDLGSGETTVLSFALSGVGWTAILDDAATRKCAESLSIRVKGTLALVLMARQHGLVPSAAEVLHSLRASSFRIDDQTARDALRRTVNEVWDA